MPITRVSRFNPASALRAGVLMVCTALLVSACATKQSSRYSQRHDSAPGRLVDVSHVKDAVPRVEPKTRWGNPPSYVVRGKRYHTLASSDGYRERGIASWYGTKFHGHRTSSGETYDMYQMTAAHKTLPLPTYAYVRNLNNGRTVIVKINDRGPFHDNRVIDLSYAAASRLGILGKGTGLVEVEAIDPVRYAQQRRKAIPASQPKVATGPAPDRSTTAETPVTTAGYRPPAVDPAQNAGPGSAPALYLQVGAFSSLSNAERLRTRLDNGRLPGDLHISEGYANQQRVYRVRIGPLASVQSADQLAAQLADQGIQSPRVVID